MIDPNRINALIERIAKAKDALGHGSEPRRLIPLTSKEDEAINAGLEGSRAAVRGKYNNPHSRGTNLFYAYHTAYHRSKATSRIK
jgi:hypothetical protein